MRRLLTYRETTEEFGATVWYWKSQVWKGNLKNCGPKKRHMLDRRDIEQLILKNKET